MPRPQKISDDTIVAVVIDLERAGSPRTGVDVRKELWRRHGVKAGTDRVYQLLRKRAAEVHSKPSAGTDERRLIRERDEAVRRAELAELREEAMQSRTALEIDTLRQTIRSLGVDPFTLEPTGSRPFRV